MIFRQVLLGGSALSIMVSAWPAAWAQDQEAAAAPGRVLETITITARRREETAQDVPVAVSAFDASALAASGVVSFDGLLDYVPNASMSGGIGGTLQGQISIRGISTLVRIVGVEPGVGYYVDGVYQGRPENFNQELIDIERVEVLRGPQGSLFGKNTIAGAFNITTRRPSFTTEGTAEVEVGNYDLARLRGYVTGPIVADRLAGKLSLGYVSRGGFVEHIGSGQDLDTLDLLSYRGQLLFTPDDATDVLLSLDGLTDRGEPAFFEAADVLFVDDPSEATPFTTNHDQPNYLDRDIFGASLQVDTDLFGGRLASITAYRSSSFDAALDDDKTPYRFFIDFFSDDVETLSQEFRLAGSAGDRLDYVLGVYYSSQKADSYRPFGLGDFLTGVPGFEPPIVQTASVDTESYAVFASADYAFADRWVLTLGGRLTQEIKDAVYLQEDLIVGLFPNINFEGSTDDTAFSPTVSLTYEASDDVMAYARFSRGFKSAGFNTDFALSADGLVVDPEYATSFEIGLKADLFGDRLRTNFAAFYTDYEDLQVSQIVGAAVLLANAASAEIMGLEGEFTAILGDYWDLHGSFGLLDAEYAEFPGCPAPGAALPSEVSADCGGNRIVLAPDLTASLGVQYRYPILDGKADFVGSADYNYQSEVFFEPQNTDRLSGNARGLLNARLGVDFGNWQAFLWGRNLTDETYVAFADDRSAVAVPLTRAYGAPRTYGASLRFDF